MVEGGGSLLTWLLDTNVVSELRRARQGRSDPNVVAWSVAQNPAALHLAAMTVFELERGVLLTERRDRAAGAVLRRWLDGLVLPNFAGRILTMDATVARRAAALHVPDPRPERDALIAATALVHGLTVVTRNVADFAPMGVPVLNPWDANPRDA